MHLYREGATVEVRRTACGKRSCGSCRAAWNRAAFARLAGGIPREGWEDVWYVVLTAPGLESLGSGADVVAWNHGAGRRLGAFVLEVRRHARRQGERCEYAATPELQERGVLHFNVLLRDAGVADVGLLQRWAVGAGFGEVVYAEHARTRVGLVRYIGGYVLKARDVFPSGFRVLRLGEGWDLRAPRVAPPNDGWLPFPLDPERVALGRLRRRERVRNEREAFDARCVGMFERRAAVMGWEVKA